MGSITTVMTASVGNYVPQGLALFDGERAHIDAGCVWAWSRADDRAAPLLFGYADAAVDRAHPCYDPQGERLPQPDTAAAAPQPLGLAEATDYLPCDLNLVCTDLSEVRSAIEFYEQDLGIAREVGDQRGEGQALGSLGIAYRQLGELRRAIAYHEQALAISRAIGDLRSEGQDLNNLANAYADLGELQRALEYYEQDLAISRRIGDRYGEALTSWNIGLLLETQGDLACAIELMQVLVDYEQELGHPDAADDAAYLAQVWQRRGHF